MTNGIIEITDSNGKITTITLGFNASAEFEKRYFAHISAKDSPNQAVMLTDLIYGGMYCQALKTSKPVPAYRLAYELVENIADMDNFFEVSAEIWANYYQSKWGQDFEKRIKDAKKKMEEQLENLN